LTQTFDTLDYLSAAGIEYIGDWVLDDEPVTLKTAHNPVVALPYNFELHDIVLMALGHQTSEQMHRRIMASLKLFTLNRGSGRKSWLSPCIVICPGCRIGSPMYAAPSRRY
jgi:hypothetical protein